MDLRADHPTVLGVEVTVEADIQGVVIPVGVTEEVMADIPLIPGWVMGEVTAEVTVTDTATVMVEAMDHLTVLLMAQEAVRMAERVLVMGHQEDPVMAHISRVDTQVPVGAEVVQVVGGNSLECLL